MEYKQYNELVNLNTEAITLYMKERVSDILGDDWQRDLKNIPEKDASLAIAYMKNRISLFKLSNYMC